MAEELIRAIYVSTATRDLRDDELISLLDVSRRNNAIWGITGVLAYHDRSFVQVLEGPTGLVEALLATIARDDRNVGMSIFDQSKVDGRTFGEWSMGWVRTSHLAQEGFDPAVLFLRDTPDTMVNALLDGFRRTALSGDTTNWPSALPHMKRD
jgi:hypothetical protein